MNKTIQLINEHPIYKQILADSFGGVIYNVANRNKYDSTGTLELIALWNSTLKYNQDSAGGIMKGAMNFIQGN